MPHALSSSSQTGLETAKCCFCIGLFLNFYCHLFDSFVGLEASCLQQRAPYPTTFVPVWRSCKKQRPGTDNGKDTINIEGTHWGRVLINIFIQVFLHRWYWYPIKVLYNSSGLWTLDSRTHYMRLSAMCLLILSVANLKYNKINFKKHLGSLLQHRHQTHRTIPLQCKCLQ